MWKFSSCPCVIRVPRLCYAGWGGGVPHILVHLRSLQVRGPPRGYFPELTNSILVVALSNVAWAEEFFRGMGLKVVTGSCYLRGFIGDEAAEKSWLSGNVEGWAESVGTLAGVSHKHPQFTYAGLQKSLHQEWEFVQQVTPGIGEAFGLVEKALRETFLLDIF